MLLYLNGGWRALLPRGGRRQSGGGLDEGCGHLRRHRSGGAGPAPTVWHITNQPHAAVHFDVGVALGCHVKDLQAVVVEPRELALVGPLPVISTNGDGGLGVEDCQLPAWIRRRGGRVLKHAAGYMKQSFTQPLHGTRFWFYFKSVSGLNFKESEL